MSDRTVLAIDPGTSKCGMALVNRDQGGKLRLLWHEVAPTETFVDRLIAAEEVSPFHQIIVGGGTSSFSAVRKIREKLPSMGILVVDETNTSLQARERYWENNPRKGWRRLLPATLQVPPEPVDDFVAYILAERVLLDR
jgi:RNase H-fold protein (predicted Holliday junction resolvase)